MNPNRAFLAFRQSHTDCTIVSMTVLAIITHANWPPNYLKPVDCDSRPQISKADVSNRLQRHSKTNCCWTWWRPGGQSIWADWYNWKPPGAWFRPVNTITDTKYQQAVRTTAYYLLLPCKCNHHNRHEGCNCLKAWKQSSSTMPGTFGHLESSQRGSMSLTG